MSQLSDKFTEGEFKVGDEITYSVNSTDYTIMNILGLKNLNIKTYQLMACNPAQLPQLLQLNNTDEMTLTNCLATINKLWPNLEYSNNLKFLNNLKEILIRVCGIHQRDHGINISYEENSFKLIFEGVEFIKTK